VITYSLSKIIESRKSFESLFFFFFFFSGFKVQTKGPTNPFLLGHWSIRILLKKKQVYQKGYFKGTIPSSILFEVVVQQTTSYNGNGSHSERDVQARVYRSGKNGGEHRQRSRPIRCVASFPYPYVPLQPRPPQRLRVLRHHRPPPQRRRIIPPLPSPLSFSCLFIFFFFFMLLDWNSIPIFSC
jgi:hypothetical protein